LKVKAAEDLIHSGIFLFCGLPQTQGPYHKGNRVTQEHKDV